MQGRAVRALAALATLLSAGVLALIAAGPATAAGGVYVSLGDSYTAAPLVPTSTAIRSTARAPTTTIRRWSRPISASRPMST